MMIRCWYEIRNGNHRGDECGIAWLDRGRAALGNDPMRMLLYLRVYGIGPNGGQPREGWVGEGMLMA